MSKAATEASDYERHFSASARICFSKGVTNVVFAFCTSFSAELSFSIESF